MTTTTLEPDIKTAPGAETIPTRLTHFETTNEPGKAAHIVVVPPERKGTISPPAYVLEARIMGFAIEALCGYVFVPHQNPERYPPCEECLLRYRIMTQGDPDSYPPLPPM